MPRCQRVASFFLALPLAAAILPEGIEFHARKAVTPITAPDAVWKEYGLQEAETAVYEGQGRKFTVSAWRLRDSTAALAAWQLLRPATSKPDAEVTKLAVRDGKQLLLAVGNYVLRFDGFEPQSETLNQLMLAMPRFENASLPSLPGFLPPEGRVANSERYIVGPASLEQFEPKIPPSIAAFQFETEGQTARYRDRDGEVRLVIFSYPNHQIAQKQIAAFQSLSGLTAGRSGPLISVVTEAPNPDAAQRVLAQVHYEANITLNTKPKPKENFGEMIVSIFELAGFLVGGCILAGLAFAGIRIATGQGFGGSRARKEEMVSLGLDGDAGDRP